jgi:hypothetical protein
MTVGQLSTAVAIGSLSIVPDASQRKRRDRDPPDDRTHRAIFDHVSSETQNSASVARVSVLPASA